MLCFDNALLLTRGSPVGLPALLSHFNPRNGIFTGLARTAGDDLFIGQVKCVGGRRNARLTFLVPAGTYDSTALLGLLDALAIEAGQWGALGVLADVDERAELFSVLRRAGYGVYGWQRIYQLPFTGKADYDQPALWRFAAASDELPIRQLHQALIPPLVQVADPLPGGRLYGLVYQVNQQIRAYVESVYGPEGIYLRPLIHPDVDNIPQLLVNLENYLSPLLGRKVYLAVRSYQAWLEGLLQDFSPEITARQALMVKHLASTQRLTLSNVHRSVVEDTRAEPSAPPMTKKSNQSTASRLNEPADPKSATGCRMHQNGIQ